MTKSIIPQKITNVQLRLIGEPSDVEAVFRAMQRFLAAQDRGRKKSGYKRGDVVLYGTIALQDCTEEVDRISDETDDASGYVYKCPECGYLTEDEVFDDQLAGLICECGLAVDSMEVEA